MKVHWGYPDPSNAEGGDDGKRRAFQLTRQAIGYRMLQLLQLPFDTLSKEQLKERVVKAYTVKDEEEIMDVYFTTFVIQ